MAWLVGIDEAGYGPNLGPLVMTAVACRLPDADADLWHLLGDGVRRHGERDDGRLLVADSKLVYSASRGLAISKKASSPFSRSRRTGRAMPPCSSTCMRCWHCWPPKHWPILPRRSGTAAPLLCPWSATAPICTPPARLQDACRKADVTAGFVRSVVICAPRFNELTDTCDSKATALAYGFTQLVGAVSPARAPSRPPS